MIEDIIHKISYKGIDESLREEVDRRIKKALARHKQERDRLMKPSGKNGSADEKIQKLSEETQRRINRILQWAREQSN